MKRSIPILAAGLLAATGAVALEPMTPEEFADFAEGKTLYFERDGEPAGAEQFMGDGRVLWRYPSGECLDGVWSAHRGMACFYYGPGTEVLCWSMSREAGSESIRAILEQGGEDVGLEMQITRRDDRPLLCAGESVGT